jgi:hypothetical protein
VDELMNAIRPADLLPSNILLEAVAFHLQKPTLLPSSYAHAYPNRSLPFPISTARKGIEGNREVTHSLIAAATNMFEFSCLF